MWRSMDGMFNRYLEKQYLPFISGDPMAIGGG
jgi:hypothetical protein